MNLAYATSKLRLSEIRFDFGHQAGVEDQAAKPFWRLPTDGKEKSSLNYVFPIFNIVLPVKVEYEDENDKELPMLNEALNAIAPEPTAVSKVATTPTPLTEPMRAKFPAE